MSTAEINALRTSTRANRSSALLSAVFFLSPLATSISPRLTPLFLAVAGAVLIGLALRRGMRWPELLPRQAALAACLLFATYVLINATWSVDPRAGFGKATLLAALILVSFAAVKATEALEKEALAQAGLAFALGALFGALFIMLELLTKGIVTRTLVTWIPELSSPKHFRTSNGALTAIRLSKLDQNVNLAMFHLWPGLLALMALASIRRAIACALFFALIATVVAISEHDSSQMALIVTCLVVLVALRWRVLVVRALAIAWCAAFALVVPASFAAYDSGLHLDDRLPNSARARIILWEFTAEETLKHPVLGVGVDSTPRLREQQKASFGRERAQGLVYPRTMGHHAHNIFLQSWYELGFVGALLLAAAGTTVALLILWLPGAAQPFAAGAFAAFAIVGAFAWGMWQSWFMCAVALLPIYVRLSAGEPRPSA